MHDKLAIVFRLCLPSVGGGASLEPGPIQERGPGRDCMRMRQIPRKQTWIKNA